MTSSALLEIRRPTVENVKRLIEALKEDNVHVIRATDVLERGGEIIGYLSIGNMPTVHMAFCSKRVVKQDYLTSLSFIEGTLARQGIQDFWLPCESTSPLLPYVERLGYVKSNFDNVFAKQLFPNT